MKVFIIILLFTSNTLANYESNAIYPNVGTVLFTSSDIYKKTWTKNQIGLLRARRYLQNVIPPSDINNTLNDDFINKLISYLKHSYSLVKKEASNPVDDTILRTALSDVIGGYLKVWALPITRYAFYGGTVSSEKALKLHKFYKDVKSYLGTDGASWRDPDPNLLRSIKINVGPRRATKTRSTSDPCEKLTFFEKSSTGLSAPVPQVNWDDTSCTMFIPLKNESVISLTSPNSTDALFRYYDTAKDCMQTINSPDENNFDEKFQDWLSKNVMPHLKDENLYLAFGSILSLINNTKNLCDTVIDLSESSIRNSREKFSIAGFPVNITSKKLMIISIIMLLEIMWCIPALIYFVCMKRKKAKDNNIYDNENNLYLCLASNNRKERRPENIQTLSRVEVDVDTEYDPTTAGRLKQYQKPIRPNVDSKAKQKIIATECSSSVIEKSHGIDNKLVKYESRSLQLKSSLKNISKSKNPISASSQEVIIYCHDKESLEQCESFSRVQKLDATKTVTLLKENYKNSRNRIAGVKADHIGNKDKKSRKELNAENSKTTASVTIFKPEEVKGRLCTCYLNGNTSISIENSKITDLTQATRFASCAICSKCAMKSSQPINNFSRDQLEKEAKSIKRRTVKIRCNKKPFLEIKVDRQKNDICSKISGTTKKERTKNVYESKPSKIPVRTMYCSNFVISRQSPLTSLREKSLIPQIIKRPADDSEIKKTTPAAKQSKLNITL